MKKTLATCFLCCSCCLADAGTAINAVLGTWELPPATGDLFSEPFACVYTFNSNGTVHMSREGFTSGVVRTEGTYSGTVLGTTNVLILRLSDHTPRRFRFDVRATTLQLIDLASAKQSTLQKVPIATIAAYPTKPGIYENRGWRYVYRTGFLGKASACVGRLFENGRCITAVPGTVTNTPVGRFVYFPYDQGWLNTRFGAVFNDDGTLQRDLKEFFDILERQRRQQAQNRLPVN